MAARKKLGARPWKLGKRRKITSNIQLLPSEQGIYDNQYWIREIDAVRSEHPEGFRGVINIVRTLREEIKKGSSAETAAIAKLARMVQKMNKNREYAGISLFTAGFLQEGRIIC